MNLLIRDALLLSMDDAVGDARHADVLVRDGLIDAVGPGLDASPDTEVIDGSGCILLPGFVDTHRHMFQAVLRGISPEHTLGQYLQIMLGRYAPALTPRDLYLGTRLSAAAALLSGVTTVQDTSNIQSTPEHTDAILAAHRESGLRTVFSYGRDFVTAQRESAALPDDARRVRAELADDNALLTMSLLTETGDDDAERANAALAADLGLRTARHCGSYSPISRLRELGALRPGTTFIHANDLDRDELSLIADSGGNLSSSPAIELVMAHGHPVLADAPDGLLLTLSNDVESTGSGDFFTTMRAAYQTARRARAVDPDRYPREITVRDVLRFATADGAAGLGLDDRAGSITPGRRADLVLLRADRPDVAPVIDPYSTVVQQADRAHVDTVLVDGVVRVRHGDLVEDVSGLLADAARTVDRLRSTGVLPDAADR